MQACIDASAAINVKLGGPWARHCHDRSGTMPELTSETRSACARTRESCSTASGAICAQDPYVIYTCKLQHADCYRNRTAAPAGIPESSRIETPARTPFRDRTFTCIDISVAINDIEFSKIQDLPPLQCTDGRDDVCSDAKRREKLVKAYVVMVVSCQCETHCMLG